MTNAAPSIRDNGAQFARHLGYGAIPYADNCRGLHFFGGSEADSLVNHAVPSKPLVIAGQESIVYGSNYAQLTRNAGFKTTMDFRLTSLTVLVMMTTSYRLSDGIPNPEMYLQMHTYSNTSYLRFYSTYDLFTTGSNMNASVDLRNHLDGGPYGARTRSRSINRQQLTAISASETTTKIVGESIGSLMSRTTEIPEGEAAVFDGRYDPVFFGGWSGGAGPSDVVWQASALMLYDRQLNEEEIANVWRDFLLPALHARGNRTSYS